MSDRELKKQFQWHKIVSGKGMRYKGGRRKQPQGKGIIPVRRSGTRAWGMTEGLRCGKKGR